MNCQSCMTLRQLCRVLYGLGIICAGLELSACALDPQFAHTDRATLTTSLSPATAAVEHGQALDDFLPKDDQEHNVKKRLGLTADQSHALGCSLGDRFDRGAALAYNFSNEQTRLALHLNIEGPSFSDPTRFEVNNVMVRFTHKLQKPIESQRKKCLYPSGFQGVVGSAYNELFMRENYTIWHELRERGLDFR